MAGTEMIDAPGEKRESFLEGYGDFDPSTTASPYEMDLGLTEVEVERMLEKYGVIRERRYRL